MYLSSNVFNEEGNIVMNGELFRDLNVYPEAVHTLEVLKDWAKAEAKE